MFKSANPRDTLNINIRFFLKGDDEDLQAMFKAAGFLQPIFNKVPNNTFLKLHPCTHLNCIDAK
jgi:hypothetical protein